MASASRTYDVRLRHARAGGGPQTMDLRAFVRALGQSSRSPETCTVKGRDGATFVILLDSGEVTAVTGVMSTSGPARR